VELVTTETETGGEEETHLEIEMQVEESLPVVAQSLECLWVICLDQLVGKIWKTSWGRPVMLVRMHSSHELFVILTHGDVVYTDVDNSGGGVVEFSNAEDMESAVRKLDDTEFKNPYDAAFIRVKLDRKSSALDRSKSRSRSYSRSRSRERKRSYSRSPSPPPRTTDDGDDNSSRPAVDAADEPTGDEPEGEGDSAPKETTMDNDVIEDDA
jgi:hypothetical protein